MPPDSIATPSDATTRTELTQALGSFVTGVTVVTCFDRAGQLQGLTANAFTALSLDPPLVLVCMNRGSRTYAAATESRRFAVQILDDGQEDVARGFADKGAARDGICAWRASAEGTPMLDRFHAALDCRLHAEFQGGDHAILVGRVDRVHQGHGAPLVYYRKRMFALS